MYTHKTYFSHKVLCSTKNKLLSLLLMIGIAPWFVSSGKLFFKEFWYPQFIFSKVSSCVVPWEALLTPSMYLYVYVCVLLRVGKKAKRSLGIFLVIWTLTHTKKGPGEEGINIKKSLSQKLFAPPWGLPFFKAKSKCLSLNHEHARSFLR